MLLDLNSYFEAVSPDSPCGEDLAYDPVFGEMLRQAQGIPEQKMGESVIPAKEPDWKKVRSLALELLGRTRDIRVTTLLTRALMHTDGFEGFDQGLTLIAGLLQRFWDCVYPKPDQDDDYPVQRMNELTILNDYATFLSPIKNLSLAESHGLWRLGWRDIELAKGLLPAPDEGELPQMSAIKAAFLDALDTHFEPLKQKASAIEHALSQAQAIVALASEKIGAEHAPDLSGIIGLLQNINAFMREQIQLKEGSDSLDGQPGMKTTQADTHADETAKKIIPLPGGNSIRNREDVVRAIDSVCEYFILHEPSSPVPLLLKRAKRLLFMDFMEILQELAPESISQAERICGTEKHE